jgi:tRNA1(Val) A37 N6-methylase TrmN6
VVLSIRPKVHRVARTREQLLERRRELEEERGEPITLDALTRDFSMYQRRRGHRHSTDDLLTAWYAVMKAPPSAKRLLDLGSGIGSVGLSVLWRFDEAKLTAIEVQDVSYQLLCENVKASELEARVRTIRGDLRHFVANEEFDLITGSPPYFDVSDGIVSADPQRAAARFELHGDVNDYCLAAAKALAPGGRFIFCFPTLQTTRAKTACKNAGLDLLAMRDVIPRKNLPALFALFACAKKSGALAVATMVEPPLIVRDDHGQHTDEMKSARATFGFDPNGPHVP